MRQKQELVQQIKHANIRCCVPPCDWLHFGCRFSFSCSCRASARVCSPFLLNIRLCQRDRVSCLLRKLEFHSYAQKNLADEMALSELVREVEDMRQTVQARQQSLRPNLEQVHMALQEDPRQPVIDMMQQSAADAESACRDIIDAGGGGGKVAQSRRTEFHNAMMSSPFVAHVPTSPSAVKGFAASDSQCRRLEYLRIGAHAEQESAALPPAAHRTP